MSHNPIRSIDELSRAIAPARDLWPGIAQQLSGDSKGRPRSIWADALALAACLAMVSIVLWAGHGRFPIRSDRPQHILSNEAHLLSVARISDPRYLKERTDLLKALPAQLAALPPATRQQVASSLTAIHKAMHDLEAALGKDSSDALLQELLTNTLQDEMRVLVAVREASEAGRRI